MCQELNKKYFFPEVALQRYKNVKSGFVKICLIILTNALIDYLCVMRIDPPVGFYFLICTSLVYGTSIYFITYQIQAQSILWRELRLFLVAAVGNMLGIVLIRITCQFNSVVEVCIPHNLEANEFAIYFFPMIFLIFTWLFGSLPDIINKRKL